MDQDSADQDQEENLDEDLREKVECTEDHIKGEEIRDLVAGADLIEIQEMMIVLLQDMAQRIQVLGERDLLADPKKEEANKDQILGQDEDQAVLEEALVGLEVVALHAVVGLDDK